MAAKQAGFFMCVLHAKSFSTSVMAQCAFVYEIELVLLCIKSGSAVFITFILKTFTNLQICITCSEHLKEGLNSQTMHLCVTLHVHIYMLDNLISYILTLKNLT